MGPIKDKVKDIAHWRIRYNKELYGIFKEAEISIVIKRTEWAGHLQRMDERNISKKVFTGQIFGKKTS
jgi:hypothetical protein